MLRLTSGLRSLTSSYSRTSRFVVNISLRNNNNWLEEEGAFLDEDPEMFGRSDMARMEIERRKFIKKKILIRKNFPKPKEASVLTWEAMQQMRFLNKEFPEEWTLDRITESFPVSRFTAIRILKSDKRIWTEEKVIRYNQSVQKNLEALQKGNVEGNEELTNVLNSLTASNKMSLLSNCGGLKGLPMPTNEQSYPDLPKLPSFKEQLAQLRVNPFTSILAKYNRLEPVTAEKENEKDDTKTQKLLHAPEAQFKGKGRSPYGEKSKSPRSPYGNEPRSKFGDSLNAKSKPGDSSRMEYGTTLKSKSDTLPGTKFSGSTRSKFGDSPRSKYGDLPRLNSADWPRSEYQDSSRSKLGHASPRTKFSDLPKSKFGNSPKISYGISPKLGIDDVSKIQDIENDDLTKSEIGNLRKSEIRVSSKSKSHFSSRSKSQDSPTSTYDEPYSNLPSMMDIGSDSVERLYMDQEEGDAVQSEITNSPAKKYLSRKEKKKQQQAKTKELPNLQTWDQMALHGTGIKK